MVSRRTDDETGGIAQQNAMGRGERFDVNAEVFAAVLYDTLRGSAQHRWRKRRGRYGQFLCPGAMPVLRIGEVQEERMDPEQSI